MKKLLILLLALAMVVAFAACGQEPAVDTPPADDPAQEPADQPEEKADGISQLKIGILFDIMVDDGGWDQSHYVGICDAIEALGIDMDTQVEYVEQVETTGGVAESTIDLMVEDGCNVIIGCSSSFQTAVESVLADYPDVTFLLFEGTAVADNYIPYSVKDSEAIFMLGYVSALLSNSDQLGFVAAQPQASVVRAVNAFTSGARYAKPDATVKVAWTNSWYDPTKETELVNALVAEGKNVIGYHGSTTAMATACAAAGVYCTGFHVDMTSYAPTAVIGSFMWNWAPIYQEAFQRVADYLDGTVDKLDTSVIYMGIEENAATVSPWNNDLVPQDIQDQANDTFAKLLSGEIKAYATPLNDNQGNQLLAEGEEFTDMALQQMYVLIEGVEGNLP